MKKFLGILVLGLLYCNIGFAECIAGDCNNGYGVYTWPDGSKYIGEYKDGKLDGQGTLTIESGKFAGDKYIGEFKDDQANGQGVYTYSNGHKYVGEYKDGKRHGQGAYTYSNGLKYVGEFKDGKRHGEGIYADSKGNKYVGEYKDDKENGQGILIWKSGEKYVGEFKDGKRHGEGTVEYENGDKHVGLWKEGKFAGGDPNFVGVGIEIIKEKEEVMIAAVLHESPASKIGLKAGDVIVSVNGLKLSKTLKLYEVASLIKGPAGSTVEMKIRRKDKIKDTAYKIVRKQITNI